MTSLKESEHLSLPFPLIEAATKKFTTRIGTGGYGHVYKGELSISGELRTVAVKRLSTKESIGGQGLKEFLTEIQLLSRYKHPNIVSLLGFCNQGDEKILIYEYAEHGSLDTYLRGACTFSWKQRINICIDAACGLDHLHNHVSENHRVIHRDIKSGNILLGHNWKAMIADLGLSKRGLTNENDSYIVTNVCGTYAYLDPQYESTGILTKESDIYSFGVVLFEVLCGRLGYMNVQDNRRFLAQLARRYYKEHKLEEIIDPGLKNQIDSNSLFTYSKIAYECLLINRPERPAIATVLKQLKDALKFQDNMDKGPKLTNYEGIKDSPRDELTTNPNKKVLLNMDNVLLDNIGVGENTYETKSEAMPFQENWIPIRLPESWDDGVSTSSQSTELSVVKNFVATCACDSKGVLDQIFGEQMGITVNILRIIKSDYNTRQLHLLDDLLIKCFSVLKKLLDNNGGGFGDSYIRHWVAIVELYKEVNGWGEDASGRLVYESVACIRIIISNVVQCLKASVATKHDEVVTNTINEILDHAKALGVMEALLSCLVTCGTSLMSGSSNLLCVACEACEAIWSLIDAFEIQSEKENGGYVFPLSSQSLDEINNKINNNGDDRVPYIGKYPEKIVKVVTQAFLNSEAIQVAIFYCLRQRLVASWSSVIQIILRCCIHNGSVASVLCGLSNSAVVSGGGDNTIVSEVFSIINLCASFDADPPQEDTNNNLKSKVSNPSDLVLHSCLLVASVAQSLETARRETANFMLTSSVKTQQSRISDLAHHYSLCDGKQNLQPHCLSAMLALSSILYLEYYSDTGKSFYDIAFPLIPQTTTLCDYIRILTRDAQGDKISKRMLSYWHGFRDGCVGLLYYKLIWAGSSEIQEFGVDIVQIYIDMLGNAHSYETGLSQYGVVWTLYSLAWYLKGGSSIFHQVLLTREHVKVMCDLISDIRLKLIGCSIGPGGGKDGIRDIVRAVGWLLSFPLDASMHNYVFKKMESADRKDMVIEIKTNMDKYIQIILEVGFPGQLIKCLEHMELKDTSEPVALLSTMVNHRSLAVELVGKGLLNPKLKKRLLDDSSPMNIKLHALIMALKVSGTDEEFYNQIEVAETLQQLNAFFTHEDPNVRGSACNLIGRMFNRISYVKSLLAKHNIIRLLVGLVFDKDNYPQSHALLAICYATRDSDLFYEDVRICIPQLAKLLLATETDNLTKEFVANCLGNLSVHSDKLVEDMISKGAIEALLSVVADFSVFALNPNKIDDINDTVLDDALYALATMCKHQPCRQFIVSSDVYPTIGQLRESPVEDIASYATLIYNRASET